MNGLDLYGTFSNDFKESVMTKAQEKDISYSTLTRDQIDLLKQIDRRELIHGLYYQQEGRLVFEDKQIQVPEWRDEDKTQRVQNLLEILDQGATFFGAFCGKNLVGMSVLNHNPLSNSSDRLNLEGLWVSHQYRGLGVGKALFQKAQQEAKARGAKSMYVSATPSQNRHCRAHRRAAMAARGRPRPGHPGPHPTSAAPLPSAGCASS